MGKCKNLGLKWGVPAGRSGKGGLKPPLLLGCSKKEPARKSPGSVWCVPVPGRRKTNITHMGLGCGGVLGPGRTGRKPGENREKRARGSRALRGVFGLPHAPGQRQLLESTGEVSNRGETAGESRLTHPGAAGTEPGLSRSRLDRGGHGPTRGNGNAGVQGRARNPQPAHTSGAAANQRSEAHVIAAGVPPRWRCPGPRPGAASGASAPPPWAPLGATCSRSSLWACPGERGTPAGQPYPVAPAGTRSPEGDPNTDR